MNWPNYDSDEQYRGVAGPERVRERESVRRQTASEEEQCFIIEQETYTSGQAARLLRIPARTLRRYLSVGRIQGNQNPITQTWHITCDALVRFIEAQGGKAVVKPGEVTVLVIDGKPVMADLLKRVAEQTRSGIVVREFQEVGDALIESGVRRPDLIVIDTATPFFDGVGLLRLLRSNPHTQSSKILAMTDSADNVDQLRAYGATMTIV